MKELVNSKSYRFETFSGSRGDWKNFFSYKIKFRGFRTSPHLVVKLFWTLAFLVSKRMF